MPTLDLTTRIHAFDRSADGDGVDLLLLHGYGVSSRAWEPLLPFLPRRHRVVTFDARNHGLSGTTSTSSIDDNVADVLDVIDALGLDHPVVVGSSIGAVWATEVAIRAPHAISAAVLVGGLAHGGVTVPGLADGNRALVEGYETDRDGTAARSVPLWFGPHAGPRVVEWTLEQIRDLRVPDASIVDELAVYDPRPGLAGVPVPMHYVHGRLDRIPFTVAQEAAAVGADTTVTIVDDAAHMPQIELPGWFAGILVSLLDG